MGIAGFSHRAAGARARERGIQFSCTPFYLDAVKELEPHVAFYKIASYELLWDDLLKACAETGKPVIISTGMATMPEIEGAVATLKRAGCRDLTVLHCVSAYPAPAEEANLSAIAAIREATGVSVGWSDHTRIPAVIERAVHRWDASAVEFHLDLDGKGAEYASGHCWLPDEIAPVIARIREGERSDGSGFKGPSRPSYPIANGAPIPSTGCVRCGTSAPMAKSRDEQARENAPRGRHRAGAHGFDPASRESLAADRRQAPALARHAPPQALPHAS